MLSESINESISGSINESISGSITVHPEGTVLCGQFYQEAQIIC